jgi:hypothetical protein
MDIQKDFADLCSSLNANSVDYLIVGGYAVAFHIMSSITGIDWEDAWASREHGTYGSVPVLFIGRAALIANKRATGRTKDLADVEALEAEGHKYYCVTNCIPNRGAGALACRVGTHGDACSRVADMGRDESLSS